MKYYRVFERLENRQRNSAFSSSAAKPCLSGVKNDIQDDFIFDFHTILVVGTESDSHK